MWGGDAHCVGELWNPCALPGSCWLDRGDVLIMDGQCQDEFVHCTDPCLEQENGETLRSVGSSGMFPPALFKDRGDVQGVILALQALDAVQCGCGQS